MKHKMNFRKLLAAGLFVAAISNVNSVNAQTRVVNHVDEKPTINVKLVGGVGENLIFEISTVQPGEGKSQLRIRDEQGNYIYSEIVNAKTFTRIVSISRNDFSKIDFVYAAGKAEAKKSLEIVIEYKEILEVKDVTKL
jgi:hypothetical protein